jgi:hypothetical protein
MLAEFHQQVAGLLSGPLTGGMQSYPENADAPAGVLDHGQDISLGAVQQVGREEAARQDRLGLGAQEQRPAWPRSAAAQGGSAPFAGLWLGSHARDYADLVRCRGK